MGRFLAYLEDEDTMFEEAIGEIQQVGEACTNIISFRWPERVINDEA